MSMLDLLDQDVFWISGDGRRYELVDMHREHRLNLLEKLRRDGHQLKIRRDNELKRRGDSTIDHQDPGQWLEQTPFVRMLRLSLALDSIRVIDGADDDNDLFRRARTLLERYERRAANTR